MRTPILTTAAVSIALALTLVGCGENGPSGVTAPVVPDTIDDVPVDTDPTDPDDTTPDTSDFAGYWNLTARTIDSSCGDDPDVAEELCLEILQDGTSIVIPDDRDGDITGTIVGDTAVLTRAAAHGTMTVRLTLDDAATFSGSARQVDADGCEVELRVTGTRRHEACPPEVEEGVVESIQLYVDAFTLEPGGSDTLRVTVLGRGSIDREVTFRSTNDAVATVGPYGIITARAPGYALIEVASVMDPSVADSAEVRVTEHGAVLDVRVDEPLVQLFVDQGFYVQVTVETTGDVSDDFRVETIAGDAHFSTHRSGNALYVHGETQGPGLLRVVSVADPTRAATINVEIDDPAPMPGTQRIDNRWRDGSVQITQGAAAFGILLFGDGDLANWTRIPVPGTDYFRLQNARTGQLLMADRNGVALTRNGADHAAQWRARSVDGAPGFTRFENRYLDGQYLHVEHGTLEVGPLQDWWSMMWSIVE